MSFEDTLHKGFPNITIDGVIEVDEGWKPIIYDMIQKISECAENLVHFRQIKEKFAGLSVYYDRADDINDKVKDIINEAVSRCAITCTICGIEAKHKVIFDCHYCLCRYHRKKLKLEKYEKKIVILKHDIEDIKTDLSIIGIH